MKKICSLLLIMLLALCCICFVSCGGEEEAQTNNEFALKFAKPRNEDVVAVTGFQGSLPEKVEIPAEWLHAADDAVVDQAEGQGAPLKAASPSVWLSAASSSRVLNLHSWARAEGTPRLL